MIPTASALSVAAGARNYLQVNYRSIDFRFEIQTQDPAFDPSSSITAGSRPRRVLTAFV